MSTLNSKYPPLWLFTLQYTTCFFPSILQCYYLYYLEIRLMDIIIIRKGWLRLDRNKFLKMQQMQRQSPPSLSKSFQCFSIVSLIKHHYCFSPLFLYFCGYLFSSHLTLGTTSRIGSTAESKKRGQDAYRAVQDLVAWNVQLTFGSSQWDLKDCWKVGYQTFIFLTKPLILHVTIYFESQ